MSICSQPARPVQELAPVGSAARSRRSCTRALAMDPAARFQTAEDMYRAVAALLPNGHWIHVSMFVPLSPGARRDGAPHHSIPGDVRVRLRLAGGL